MLLDAHLVFSGEYTISFVMIVILNVCNKVILQPQSTVIIYNQKTPLNKMYRL